MSFQPSASRPKHHLLPEPPDCGPALQIVDFQAATNAWDNSSKHISLCVSAHLLREPWLVHKEGSQARVNQLVPAVPLAPRRRRTEGSSCPLFLSGSALVSLSAPCRLPFSRLSVQRGLLQLFKRHQGLGLSDLPMLLEARSKPSSPRQLHQ